MNDNEIHELLMPNPDIKNIYLFNFNPNDERKLYYNIKFTISLFFSIIQKLKDIFNPNQYNYIGDNKTSKIINYKCKNHNLPYKLYIEDLFMINSGYMLCEKCNKNDYYALKTDYDKFYYFDDYKFRLKFKINKILNNIKNAEITIHQKLYPLYLKYVDKLEGKRKKRFKRNYYSIHKKMKILKNFINNCIRGYNTNKFGFIYCLYYFPEISINEFNIINNISEDIYIQKLSSFFCTNKWINLKRRIMTEDDYKNINNYFIVTDKKYEIDTPSKKEESMFYIDEKNSKKILDNNNIKYIDEENGTIYYFENYIDNENEQINLIILTKSKNSLNNEYEYEIIYKKIFYYINYDDENNTYTNYVLGEKCNIKNRDLPNINSIKIKKFYNNIYIITNIFICIINSNLRTEKIIIISHQDYKDLFLSFIEKVIKVKNYLIVFREGPNITNVIDLKNHELIFKIKGLSGDFILELKHSKNILILNEDKIIVFNYIKGQLIDIHYFNEVYLKNQNRYSIVYKNNIIGDMDSLKLKYILQKYKNIKYDYIINEDKYIINIQNL